MGNGTETRGKLVKDVLGREKDMCKGPGVDAFWVCSRSRKEDGGKWGEG